MIDVDKFMERIEKEMLDSLRCVLCQQMNLVGLHGLTCDGPHFVCASCYPKIVVYRHTVSCPTCHKDCQKTGEWKEPLKIITEKMGAVKDLVKKKLFFLFVI